MINSVWTEKFRINSFHVDFQQKIKPSVLMEFFQEVASNHAAHLGAGYDVLRKNELFWALSRLTVEVERWPLWGETIEIETWPCGLEGLFFRRDFIIRDRKNEIIARGVSGWILLSSKNLRPQRAHALNIAIPENEGKRAMNSFPSRLENESGERVFSKQILYNEIDMNMHVNNTRYLDWVMDCFDANHFKSRTLKQFTLEFLAETHWGNNIELFINRENNQIGILARNSENQKNVFKAETNWTSTST